MKRTTVTESYDENGKLTERVTVTEEDMPSPVYQPYQRYPYPLYQWPTYLVTSAGTTTDTITYN